MRIVRWVMAAAVAVAVAAPVAAQDDAVAKLERRRAASPRSVAALRALGVAYYKAQRFADATSVLTEAKAIAPKDGVVALYLGLAAEGRSDLAAAKAAYTDYLAVGRSRGARTDVSQRLAAIARQELAVAAKAAVAAEQQIGQQAGPQNTVAVLPFTFSGPDTSLKPLERGFAELLVTDLARSGALTVLERERMQALLDEIQLNQAARADQGTSVRAGRLIRAGRVVQGSLNQVGQAGLRADAAAVDVSSSAVVGDGAQQQGQLDQLFDIEKRLAFGIFEDLGITLTAQERALIDERPTRSFQAFLAYSRGLVAADQGRLSDAARFFDDARGFDPGFGLAAQRATQARAAATGAQITAGTIESKLRGTAEGAVVDAAARGTVASETSALPGLLTQAVVDVNPSPNTDQTRGTGGNTNPSNRDPQSQTTGAEQPAPPTGRLTILIRQP
jgi:TolB-like protein